MHENPRKVRKDMKVRDCMNSNVIWLTPDSSIGECAKIMNEQHIGSVPICNDDQNVVGFVTDRDILLRAVVNNKDINNTKVSEIMTTGVYCCEANTDVEQASKTMAEYQVRRLPVTESNKIVGILTLTDLSRNEHVSDFKFATTYDGICNYSRKNNC